MSTEEEKRLARRAAEKRYRERHRERYLERRRKFRKKHQNRLREEAREYVAALGKDTLKARRRSHEPRRKQKYIENLIPNMLRRASLRAKKKGIEFSLAPTDIVIPSICPVLGILLVPAGTGRRGPSDSSPSLDRINVARGYVPGNVAVISHRANMLKRDATLDEVKAVLRYMKRHLAR